MFFPRYPQGSAVTADGVHYRVWAPAAKAVAIEVRGAGKAEPRRVPLAPDAGGYHQALDPAGVAGDQYLVWVNEGAGLPCPASRAQPNGVNGPSLVVDPRAFNWTDAPWVRPPFRDLVIYELHVGTFTPEGTFRAVIDKLPYLRDLGVNALELMPVHDFPGTRGWGYDGVRLFAPANVYGSPDDLRALVDAAHAHGCAVILDVVFNHFGPDGNFLRLFSPEYFESRHHTPWGEALNFSNAEVRAYFAANVRYWMDEYHFDGFRLDATHQIFDDSPKHILAELTEIVRERGAYIIAEDERNYAQLIEDASAGGFAMHAVWADDFHHTVEVACIDASMYSQWYEGELSELVETLQDGWLYRGKPRGKNRKHHGTPCAHLPPERFIFCISNHDQAGNRALGERLHHFVSAETYRAASALLCLTPFTPLLFMGQEWGCTSPFLYFTDHVQDLGRLVEKGRREELRKYPIFDKLLDVRDMPPPQAASTFERSKLDWRELEKSGHATCLDLYRAVLRLRREHAAFRPAARAGVRIAELACGALALRATAGEDDWLVICDLRGGRRGRLDDDDICASQGGRAWRLRLSTNDARFGGLARPSFTPQTGELDLQLPELLAFQAE